MSATPPPQTTAPVHVDVAAIVAPPAVFYALALFTFTLRMIARWKATGLQLDDGLLALSMVSTMHVGSYLDILTSASAISHGHADLLCSISALWIGKTHIDAHTASAIHECTHADSTSRSMELGDDTFEIIDRDDDCANQGREE